MSLFNDLKLKNLPLLFCFFYLTACEQGPQTIYLNEVERYDDAYSKENRFQDLLQTPPFLKSKNFQLDEIRRSFYEENNDVLDLSCQKNIEKNEITLPKIKIIAESHNCPNCTLDLSKNLIKGRNGEIIFAIEGIAIDRAVPIELGERGNLPPLLNNLPTSNKLAFGIDTNSSISGLALTFETLYIQSKLQNDKDKNELLNLNPALLYKMNNYEGEATTAIFKSFVELLSDPERDEVLEILFQENSFLAKKISYILANISKIIETISDPDQIDIARINLINKNLTFNYLYEIMEKTLKIKIELFIKKNKNTLSKRTLEYLSSNRDLSDEKNLEIIKELFLVDIRNKEFSRNISKIYCNFSLPAQKDLTIVMGAAHANAQKFLLEKMFADLKVKPSIEVDNIDLNHIKWTIPQRKKDVIDSLKEIQSYK